MHIYTQTLYNTEETVEIGKKIAQALTKFPSIKRLLLFGDLGAGKTTFTRGFVSNFENAHLAEVTSPTFTLVNHYPTSPPVIHADIYRLAEMAQCELTHSFPELPEELDSLLYEEEKSNTYALIEWAEFLDLNQMTKERLDIFLKVGNTSYSLIIKSESTQALALFKEIENLYK